MSRRYHSKSRFGCAQCKRRHIKCDETRPVCMNCSVSKLQCAYGALAAPAPAQGRQSSAGPTASMRLTTPLSSVGGIISPEGTTPAGIVQPSPISPSLPTLESANQAVNMHHMELLSHFIRETSLIFGPAHSSATRMSLATTLSTPYLIHQLLALSALHLSYLHSAKAKEYAEEAAVFQANSFSLLNSTTVEINKENCVPMLLFSSLLGIYMLADAVITSDGSNSHFLDKYITYLNVHRGVHAVVDGFWDYLRQTELSPFLNTAAHLEPTNTSQDEIEGVCRKLQELLAVADMGQTSLKACQEAIQHLKWVLGSVSQTTADTIYSWPILLSADFTGLLAKRRPEALIILAHYAVVLHERRALWVVGNSGTWLIEAITVYLGTYWREWLVWPNEALLHVTSPGGTLFLGSGAR